METSDGERSVGKGVRSKLSWVVWLMVRRRLEGVGIAGMTMRGRHVNLRRCNSELYNEFGFQLFIPWKNDLGNRPERWKRHRSNQEVVRQIDFVLSADLADRE